MRPSTTAWRLAGLLGLVRYGGIATWWGLVSDETVLTSTNCAHEESPSVLIVAIHTSAPQRHPDDRHTLRRAYETMLICAGCEWSCGLMRQEGRSGVRAITPILLFVSDEINAELLPRGGVSCCCHSFM
ncbi:hypothetical protein F5Y01DRAFT_270222 [Xylaria sp. FL0043]|nr:hypothetical protein F5Y01DRAFT_270222 [Xylaria sp. FL0043]